MGKRTAIYGGILTLILCGGTMAAASPSPYLNYKLKAKDIGPACAAAKAKADKGLMAVVDLKAEGRTFANTVLAFENTLAELSAELTSPVFLKYVSGDKAVRDAGHECETLVEKTGVLLLPPKIYYSELMEVPGDRFRIGFGRRNIAAGLAAMSDYLIGNGYS